MNKKLFDLKIEGNFIVVFYRKKELFKVINNINNASNLLKMLEK